MLIFCKPFQGIAIAVLCAVPLLGFGVPLPDAKNADAVPNSASGNPAATPKEPVNPLLVTYRDAVRKLDNVHIQNRYLKDQLDSQQQEKASLQKQMLDIEVTKPGIVPLILRMLDGLDKFIQMDLPFLSEERQQRLALLKQTVVKADITNAEKFRRIIEAFQIENEYGKTIEAYKANIMLKGEPRSVNFLRLGRVGLYYQHLDGSETGYWNVQENRWEVLPNEYSNAIRQGLRIARKETAPDMLIVPVSAPEAAQ